MQWAQKISMSYLWSLNKLYMVCDDDTPPRGADVHLSLQEALSNMDDYDKTCLEAALLGVCNIVQQEWGAAIPCQVMVGG